VAESRTVTVPVVVERDEDGVWCAHAQLRPGVGAHGQGDTEEAALEDLREALTGLIEEFGVPREPSITVAA
jgi:predicted RNase H-like HicB family nuclease